jgi:hypothetical protein
VTSAARWLHSGSPIELLCTKMGNSPEPSLFYRTAVKRGIDAHRNKRYLIVARIIYARTLDVAYKHVIEEVIAAYWRDYDDHKNEFVPAFLANDILRLWRTFCVNYEARTSTDPPHQRAKRRLKNYKLKHSRLLTSYSQKTGPVTALSKNSLLCAL